MVVPILLDSGLRRNDVIMIAGEQAPTAGAKLPSIALPATTGELIDLAALRRISLVAVYPWTGRPGLPNPPNWDDIQGAHGSTPELEGFRDLYAEFERLCVPVFGLSRQDTAYQREVAERLRLPFPILSDSGGAFASALALPSFRTGDRNYLKRLTLVIDAGRIAHVFFPVPDPAGHAREVLQWLDAQDSSPLWGEGTGC
jgi:peroxiredoxin